MAWLGLDRTFRALARLGKEPPVLEDDVRFRVSAPSVGARMQREDLHAQRVLTRMAEHGLVAASPGTARRTYPRYSLTPAVVAGMRAAVTYRTGSLEADDAKLIRHLRRYGQIANENVRAYLDCDVSTARNRLTRLRTRGLIDFAPDSPRRGSGVQYVWPATPGPPSGGPWACPSRPCGSGFGLPRQPSSSMVGGGVNPLGRCGAG
jgi:ATP-dependent DNA helicase RecG